LRGVYQAWVDYPLPEGYRLRGQYELKRLLGAGSYGLAYLAEDAHTGQPVVLKQAKPSKRRLGRSLLVREHEALRTLAHPHIPACGELIEDGRRLWLPIEWVDGATVEDLIFEQGRGFTELESLNLLRRLLQVVQFVHERGWVHLDLRIPNVMERSGRLMLIDFGLARRIGDMDGLEKPKHQEDEWRRLPTVQSDLYALGHLLLFLLYSSYEEKEDEAGDWREELVVSPATRLLLNKLMKLEQGYSSAAELAEAVDRSIAALTAADG